jgi:hypothetical protein
LGNEALIEGDYATAATCFRSGLEFALEVGSAHTMLICIEGITAVAVRERQWDKAAFLLGATERHRQVLIRRRTLDEQARFTETTDRTRSALGESRWNQSIAEAASVQFEAIARRALGI